MSTDNGLTSTRSTIRQFILWVLSYFSTIAPGISYGYAAIALPPLLDSSSLNHLTPSQGSWFVSVISIGTPLGCLISGPISDRYGRRASILWINASCLFGWVLITIAYHLGDYQYNVLLFGRFMTGLSMGLATMPPVVYLAEISSTKYRGVFTSSISTFFAIGLIFLYGIGYIYKDDWGSIALITSILPCCSVIFTFIYFPESPAWLVSQNRIIEARKSLRKIYGYQEYNQEIFEDIQTLVKHRDASKISGEEVGRSTLSNLRRNVGYFKRPTFYKPFGLFLIFFFFQQASGGFVLVFYAMDIIVSSGTKADAYLVIIGTAVVRFVGTIICCVASRYIDRRLISVFSGFLMTTTLLSLAIVIYIEVNEAYNWTIAFLLISFFFACSLGFMSIPFGLAAECFPGKMRGTMTGLLTFIAYLFNFAIVKVYPDMIKGMGVTGILVFYGGMSLAGTVFVARFIPETKGKTLIEIEEYFEKS